MNSSLPHSVRQKKTDQEGNANPRSIKLAPQSNKKFIEDNSKKAPSFQNTPNQIGRINQNLRKKTQTSQDKKFDINDNTSKKLPINSKKPEPEEATAPKKKKQFKKSQPPQKVLQYIYIYDPLTQNMRKHLVVQDQQITSQLNKYQDYIPPFHTCDQDCDSSDEIVKKGVEKSKRDLFAEIKRRKLLKIAQQRKIIPKEPHSDSGQQSDDEKETKNSKDTK